MPKINAVFVAAFMAQIRGQLPASEIRKSDRVGRRA